MATRARPVAPPPPASSRPGSARRRADRPPSPRSARPSRPAHPEAGRNLIRRRGAVEVAAVGDPLHPSPGQAPMMGTRRRKLGDVTTLMPATLLQWEPGQLLHPIEADLARGQLLRRLGSLRQAGAGPTDATGRLLRHIGPRRHPFDNRPVPIPSCEPRDRFSPTAAICTARHEAISPSARTISSSN